MSHKSFNDQELSVNNIIYMMDLRENIPIVIQSTIDELLSNNKIRISRTESNKKIENIVAANNVHTDKTELLREWRHKYEEYFYRLPLLVSNARLTMFYLLSQLKEIGESIPENELLKYKPRVEGLEL